MKYNWSWVKVGPDSIFSRFFKFFVPIEHIVNHLLSNNMSKYACYVIPKGVTNYITVALWYGPFYKKYTKPI